MGSSPVKDILKKRARLLVRHLLWKDKVCVVLEWESTHELPSIDRMDLILRQLTEIVSDRDNGANERKQHAFRKVSFVLAIPAYYLPSSLPNNQQKIQKDYAVNLLNCTECRTLFDEKVKATEGLAKCKADLESDAKEIGITLDRMIWVQSFGRPKQVLDILDKKKYDSVEAWISLCEWWRQVYVSEQVNDEKKDWLSYLYMLALHGQMLNGSVDAEKILKDMFANDRASQRNIRNALHKICSKTKDFRLCDLDTLLIFEEPYVRERFILSLGTMDDGAGSDIFNFESELRDAVGMVFKPLDPNVCRNLASMYLDIAGMSPNLAAQLSDQYTFAEKLADSNLGNGSLAAEYGRQLRDPIFMRGFVEKVISRLGALNIAHCAELFKSINKTLLENNPASGYVNLAFEMLPAYVIAKFLPHAWGVDFKTVIDEFDRVDADDEVRFKCAVFIFNAYMHIDRYRGATAPVISDLFALSKPAYQRVKDHALKNRGMGHWDDLCEMLPVVEAGLSVPQLPDLDLAAMPQAVRTAWLCLLYYTMTFHAHQVNLPESMEVTDRIYDLLHNVGLGPVDWLVGHACKAMMPYRYDLDTDDGKEAMARDINVLRQYLGRWSECPAIARHHFKSLCYDYSEVYRQRKQELLVPGALWELLGKLREWQNGLCDYDYSCVLEDFAILLRDISASDVKVDLRSEWKEFAEFVKGFWIPAQAKSVLEDSAMSSSYFGMYSCLSNTEAIEHEWRRALLQDITRNWSMLCTGYGDYVDAAMNLFLCNQTLILPGSKLYWIARLYSGDMMTGCDTDQESMIAAGEKMLAEARVNPERKVDEELIAKLHKDIEDWRQAANNPQPYPTR
jgi:hypothetical protein